MILLVDGDLLVFRSLMTTEKEILWEPDIWTLHSNSEEGITNVRHFMDNAISLFDPTRVVVCFSGSRNFRKDILPSYKGNRVGLRKPLGYKAQVEAIMSDPQSTTSRGTRCSALRMEGIEADDAIGILATKPANLGKCIIVSQDKDFKQIPETPLWRGETDENGPILLRHTQEEADRWHLLQTLAGDVTDGYSGCPGIGMETGKALLEKGLKYRKKLKVISKGKRQGMAVEEWEQVASGSPWETVLSCYEKAGRSEEEALVMARVAKILRHSDWDYEKKEPKLWVPSY